MIRKKRLTTVIDSVQQCKAQFLLTNQRTGVNVINSSQTQTQRVSKKLENRPTHSQTLHHIHQWLNFALRELCSIKFG